MCNTSECSVDALCAAGVDQVVLYSYGMKCQGGLPGLGKIRMPMSPIAPCRWDFGIEFDIMEEGIKVPFFLS